MVQQFEFFQVSLITSLRNMFLSKAFSMSQLNIYQILRLNYYKKEKEWWTDDVDGDCINFNLYRNTESSIVLLKRWRGDFRKEEYCQVYQQGFYLEELTQSEWSISEKKRMEESMNQMLKEDHFDYCFELDTNTKSRFVRRFFNRLSNI